MEVSVAPFIGLESVGALSWAFTLIATSKIIVKQNIFFIIINFSFK
jgi:hypothetical protein